jgi:hypothetical protein
MIYNDPMLPRAVLRGDNLFVGNETDPYFRVPGYVVDFEVTGLQIYGSHEAEDMMRPDGPKEGAKTRPVEGLRGQAILHGRNRFAVVGVQTEIKPRIDFHLLPVLAGESEYHWRANIGFRMNDREFETERGFWIQAYCTRQSFDEILAMVRKKQLTTLRRIGNHDVDQAKGFRACARCNDDFVSGAACRSKIAQTGYRARRDFRTGLERAQ